MRPLLQEKSLRVLHKGTVEDASGCAARIIEAMSSQPHEIDSPSPWGVRWAGVDPARRRVLTDRRLPAMAAHLRYLSSLVLPSSASIVTKRRSLRSGNRRGGSCRLRTSRRSTGLCAWRIRRSGSVPLPASTAFFRNLSVHCVRGGVLIYETFALGNERYGGRATRRSCFGPMSCSTALEPLAVVAFEQGLISAPQASAVIQRVCAVRADASSHRLRPFRRHPTARRLR